jgi:ribosome maturation factor RimP
VERKLAKLDHWRRFNGKKANIVLTDTAAQEVRHFEGVISRVDDAAATIAVELPDGALVVFPFDQVDHANLKFEW